MPAKRRGRKIVIGLLVVVLIAAVLLALAPTLISLGPGRGVVANAISDRINGQARLDSLSLSWLGDQSVKGLVITGEDGREAANLDITLNGGLLSLLGGIDSLDLKLAGSLEGELREGGGSSFQDLIPSSGKRKEDKTKAPAGGEDSSPALAGIPPTNVAIDGLKVTLVEILKGEQGERVTGDTLVLNSLAGALVFEPGGKCDLNLDTATKSRDLAGSISIKLGGSGLFDEGGRFTPKGATLTADGTLAKLPVFFDQTVDHVENLSLKATSDDLTGSLRADVAMNAVAGDENAGSLTGDIVIAPPFNDDGAYNLGPQFVTGQIIAQNISCAMLQPFLDAQLANANEKSAQDVTSQSEAATDDTSEAVTKSDPIRIDLVRDLGPKLNAKLSIKEPAETPGEHSNVDGGATKAVEAEIRAEHVLLEMRGEANSEDGSVEGTHLLVRGRIDPLLVAEFSDVGISEAAGVEVTLSKFFLPGRNADNELNWASLSAEGVTGKIQAPISFVLNDEVGKVGTVREFSGRFDLKPNGGKLLLTGEVNTVASLETAALAEFTDLRADRPLEAVVELESIKVPVDPDTKKVAIAEVGAEALLKLLGTASLTLPVAGAQDVSIDELSFTLSSDHIKDGLAVIGSASVGDGTIAVNERITGLIGADGNPAPREAKPVGSVIVRDIDGELVASFLPESAGKLNPLLKGAIDASVESSLKDGVLAATAVIEGRDFNTTLVADLKDNVTEITSGTAELSVSPELAAAFQPDAKEPIVPLNTMKVKAEVSPFQMVDYQLPTTPLLAKLDVEEAVFAGIPGAPPLAEGETLSIRELKTSVSATLNDAPVFELNGGAILNRPSAERNLGRIEWDLEAKTASAGDGAEPTLQPGGSVTLKNISTRHIELMLGKPRGAFSDWLGARGDVVASLESDGGVQTVTIEPKMPNLTGKLAARQNEEVIWLSAEKLKLDLPKESLQSIMTPEDGKETDSASTLTAAADMTLELNIRKCSLPKAVLSGEKVRSDQFKLDMALTGGPLKLADAEGNEVELEDISALVTAEDLAEGIRFDVTGQAAGGADAGKGKLKIEGGVRNLLAEDSTFDASAATVQLTAEGQQIPTAVPDVLGGMNGLLVAALGALVNGNAVADDFSADDGTLEFAVQTTNGKLEGLLRGKEGTLRTSKSKPVQGQLALTEPLREMLLYKIHPILADIRTVEESIRFGVPYGVIPTDGDVSNLKADLEITVGAVEMDSGSTVLGLLAMANQSHKASFKGYIEPINVRIRNGILRYEIFSIKLDKYTLDYSGEVNLVDETVDLRTEIPLEGLAITFEELTGYTDKIVVPLVTRGKFGDLKTEVDPDFDFAEAAIRAGFTGALKNALGEEGGAFGDLFKKLIEGDKDKGGGGP